MKDMNTTPCPSASQRNVPCENINKQACKFIYSVATASATPPARIT